MEKKYCILLVEDDVEIRNGIEIYLKNQGYDVIKAGNGEEGLKALENATVHLAILDIMMPVMDGYELLRRVRNNTATQNVPVILLTALDMDEKRLKGIEQGADAYITKPFDTQLLIATCRRLIEQREKQRQETAIALSARIIAPPEIIVEERDKRLLDAMNLWLYNHISSPTLSVDELAESMGYNRSIFYKKVKALTGQTPADYIRTLRMDRAAQMLEDDTVTVAEVCYSVGISDPHYFTKIFKQQFGITPKKYQQGKKSGEPTPPV